MSQFKHVCTVTQNTQTVVMPGVDATLYVKTGYIFMVEEELVRYTIASDGVYANGNTTFTITGAYQQATNAAAPGVVATGYTFPDNIPTLSPRDVGTASIFTEAMYRIQELITAHGMGAGGPIDNTDQLTEGLTNLFHTEDRVRNTTLLGMSLVNVADVTVADTVRSAIGKLWARLVGHVGARGSAVHGVATTVEAGFMSPADKTKLDSLTPQPPGGVGTVTQVVGVGPVQIFNETTTPTISILNASTSSSGLMSAADKVKLDALTTQASGGGMPMTMSATPPTSPQTGDHWLDLNTGIVYVWVTDSSGSQWVQV